MNGKVVDCNQAALEMFGYAKKEEMVGEDVFAVISSKDRAKVMEDLTALAQKGPIKDIGVRMVAKDGREFVAEASASLVRDASGNPKYVVTLVRDITERKQMEQKLEEYSQQLEEMVEYRTKQLKDTQERLVKSERLAAIGQVGRWLATTSATH
jgi:PAS domain S-box-containing protein